MIFVTICNVYSVKRSNVQCKNENSKSNHFGKNSALVLCVFYIGFVHSLARTEEKSHLCKSCETTLELQKKTLKFSPFTKCIS